MMDYGRHDGRSLLLALFFRSGVDYVLSAESRLEVILTIFGSDYHNCKQIID